MIQSTTTSNEEVFRVVQKLERILIKEQPAHAIVACLSTVLLLQYPNITQDQMAEGVHGLSQWAAMYLDSLYTLETPADPIEKGRMH